MTEFAACVSTASPTRANGCGAAASLAHAALAFERVTFAYRAEPVVREVSFGLPAGELTCIVGKNGSGKSTLVQLADGLLRPRSGRVLLGDRDLAQVPAKERARGVGVLFQQYGVPAATVEELAANGRFPHADARRLGEADVAAVEAALARMGLAALKDRPLAELSGGQRQRAFLAMVLAQDTPVLLLDEPTASLDAHAAHEVMALARDLAREGKAVCVVIHDLDLALRYADHLVVLDAGRVAGEGTSAQMLASGVVQRVFAMRVVEVPDAQSGERGHLLFPASST